MTDKKNWKDSLSAKAKELAPKAPAQESVDVEIGGKVVKIVRGDMSDEQWNHVKQRAVGRRGVWESSFDPTQKTIFEDAIQEKVTGRKPKEEPRPPEPPSVEKKDDGKISPADKYQIERLYRRVGKAVMEQEDNRDPLNDLQMQSKAMPQTQEDRDAGKLTDENSPVQTARIPGTSPDQGTPDEWKPMPRDGKLRESDSMSAAGVSGSTPMARMASMAQQAATGVTTKDGVVDNYSTAAEQAGQALNAAENARAGVVDTAKNAVLGAEAVRSDVAGAVKDIVAPDFSHAKAGQIAKTMMSDPVSVMFQTGAPNDLDMIEAQAARDPGVDYDPATDPVSAAPKPPVQPPAPGGESPNLAMSIAGNMPTGFSVAQVDPAAKAEYDKSRANAQAGIENAKERVAAIDIMQEGVVREAAKREKLAMAEAAEQSRLASEAKLFGVREMQRLEGARMKVVEEARRAAAEPTDPNRFWNNKTDGQKAAGIIAAALFGFTGQGMNWLNRVDALVENDMRAQMADRASKVQGLQSEAAALGEAGQRALQAGATQAEAFLIEKQAKIEGLKSYLEMASMNLNNLQAQQRAAQMMNELDMKSVALGQQQYALAQHEADRKTDANYKNAVLQGEKYKATLAAVGKANENANRPLPEAGAKLMDEYSSAVQALQEMQGKLKNSGPGNRLLQKFAQSNFVPGNADEKALYNDYRALKYKWMTLKARGALQGIEIAALEDMLPERGQVMSDPAAQVGAMEQTAVRDFQRAIAQQEAAGFDMSRYKALAGPSKPQYGNVQFQPK